MSTCYGPGTVLGTLVTLLGHKNGKSPCPLKLCNEWGSDFSKRGGHKDRELTRNQG